MYSFNRLMHESVTVFLSFQIFLCLVFQCINRHETLPLPCFKLFLKFNKETKQKIHLIEGKILTVVLISDSNYVKRPRTFYGQVLGTGDSCFDLTEMLEVQMYLHGRCYGNISS